MQPVLPITPLVHMTLQVDFLVPASTQQDMPAERRTRRNGTPLVPLFTLADAPPLAELIHTWRTSLGERTATALYRLSMDTSLPPPVRYLLCAQALESLHSEDHAEEEGLEDESYGRERTAAVAALAAVPDGMLSSSAKKFLRKHLHRRPLRSIANRLHDTLSSVPEYDVLAAAWMERTEPLVPHLTALNYRTEPLAERLGSIRNVLSHGSGALPNPLVNAANQVLETLLRGQLLSSLGFAGEQLNNAYTGMIRASDM